MVSLADIAFLTIFFLVLSASSIRDTMGIFLPQLARTTETESPISVTIDAKAQIYLNGEAVGSPSALERQLRSVLSARSNPRDCEVRLRCDKKLAFKDYREVYEAISHAGGVIAIMHDLKR